MNTAIYTGGPAFPVSGTLETGLTMRDYFAAKAMQAYYMDPDVAENIITLENVARWSYEMADAMLKAREVGHD